MHKFTIIFITINYSILVIFFVITFKTILCGIMPIGMNDNDQKRIRKGSEKDQKMIRK